MLTIKEAAGKLNLYGINATEQEILMWIEAGFLEAESYKIHPNEPHRIYYSKKY